MNPSSFWAGVPLTQPFNSKTLVFYLPPEHPALAGKGSEGESYGVASKPGKR